MEMQIAVRVCFFDTTCCFSFQFSFWRVFSLDLGLGLGLNDNQMHFLSLLYCDDLCD